MATSSKQKHVQSTKPPDVQLAVHRPREQANAQAFWIWIKAKRAFRASQATRSPSCRAGTGPMLSKLALPAELRGFRWTKTWPQLMKTFDTHLHPCLLGPSRRRTESNQHELACHGCVASRICCTFLGKLQDQTANKESREASWASSLYPR